MMFNATNLSSSTDYDDVSVVGHDAGVEVDFVMNPSIANDWSEIDRSTEVYVVAAHAYTRARNRRQHGVRM